MLTAPGENAGVPGTLHRLLLRIWRNLTPEWLKPLLLRILNPSYTIGTAAVIQSERGEVLLLQPAYRSSRRWTLPGGFLKRNESPEIGVAREVREETGLDVQVEKLLGATIPHSARHLTLLYRCRVVGGALRTSDESAGVRWIPPAELSHCLGRELALLRKAGIVPAE